MRRSAPAGENGDVGRDGFSAAVEQAELPGTSHVPLLGDRHAERHVLVLAGDLGTLVKLTRVVLLAPALVVLGLASGAGGKVRYSWKEPPIPWFVLGFLAVGVLGSVGVLPTAAKAATLSVVSALWRRRSLTLPGSMVGRACRTTAAAPATSGVAIEVPDIEE